MIISNTNSISVTQDPNGRTTDHFEADINSQGTNDSTKYPKNQDVMEKGMGLVEAVDSVRRTLNSGRQSRDLPSSRIAKSAYSRNKQGLNWRTSRPSLETLGLKGRVSFFRACLCHFFFFLVDVWHAKTWVGSHVMSILCVHVVYPGSSGRNY